MTSWQSWCEYKAITECGVKVGTTTAKHNVKQMPMRAIPVAPMQLAFAA